MSQTQLLFQTVVGVATVAGGTALAVRLGRVRSSTATALRSVVVVLVVTTVVATVAAVSAGDPAWLPEAVSDEAVGTLTAGLTSVVGVPWFVFAFRYTGRGRLLTPLVRGVLTVVAVGAVAAQFVVTSHTARPQSVEVAASALVLMSVRGLLLAAAVIVVWESIGDVATPLRQGVGLGVAALSPPLSAVFPGTVVAGLGLSVAVLAAVVRLSDPFDRLPAAGVVGRDRLFGEMSASVVVVDTDGVVRDLNDPAETAFETSHTEAVGEPLGDVVPSLAAAGGDSFQTRTTTGRHLQVSVTRVTDDGESVGQLFVCRDVTERRNRERRLQLVTQLLADAVHEQMSAVARSVGRPARGVSDGSPEPAVDGSSAVVPPTDQSGTDPRITATALATVVNDVRELERALDDSDTNDRVRLDELLHDAVDDETSVNSTTDTTVAGTDAPLVRATVGTLCEAGTGTTVTATETTVETTETTVETTETTVETNTTDDEVSITVSGDPPTDHTAGLAAVTLARIVADTLGGTVETAVSGGAVPNSSMAPNNDAVPDSGVARSETAWRVAVTVPVEDGTIAVPPQRPEGGAW